MNSTQNHKKQFSVQSFYKMWEAGIFDTKERIELIQGTFYQKSTKTPIFCYCISPKNLQRHQSYIQSQSRTNPGINN